MSPGSQSEGGSRGHSPGGLCGIFDSAGCPFLKQEEEEQEEGGDGAAGDPKKEKKPLDSDESEDEDDDCQVLALTAGNWAWAHALSACWEQAALVFRSHILKGR